MGKGWVSDYRQTESVEDRTAPKSGRFGLCAIDKVATNTPPDFVSGV